MKIAARKARPKLAKDCFDLFVYVHMMTASIIAEALSAGGDDGERIRGELRALFADEEAQGVRDVLEYASSLEAEERALLGRSVIDLIGDATRE